MKIILPVILAIILAIGGFAVGFYNGFFYQDGYGTFSQKNSSLSNLSTETKELHLKSLEASRTFAKANLLTQMVLSPDKDETDYQTWQRDITHVIGLWEELEIQSGELEKKAEEMAGLYQLKNIDLFSIPVAEAATKFDAKKINAIYDAAPAGKKIRTLAKQLNVDAKRAYKMLKMAQNQVAAEAWDEAGDTFETLENTARAIKDVSKVTVYVGGAALSGGAVSTVGTILSEGGAIIGGVDLLFEVGEDASAIAFGYDHKSVAMLGDLRKITEPAASIIGLANITNASNAFDRWNAVLFGADQINSAVQENKYLGIKVNFDEMVIESEGMNKEKMEKWMEKEKIAKEPSEELIGDVLEFSEAEQAMVDNFMGEETEQITEVGETEEVDETLDTFDFIEQNDSSNSDSEFDLSPLFGIWRVVGTNSENDIITGYDYIYRLEFGFGIYCHFEGDDLRRIGSPMEFSFDEKTGTGKIGTKYTMEYGEDKNHLLVHLINPFGSLEYLYFKKTNEQVD